MFAEYPKVLKHDGQKAIVRDKEEESEVLKDWGLVKDEYELEKDSFRNKLLAKAAALNIKVDNRWTDKRLQRLVEEASGNN